MLNCLEPECIGWHLLPSDQFCAWCGSQLAELSMVFEEKVGEAWHRLEPPLLVRDQRPALRLVIRHVGRSGSVGFDPARIECSASWFGLDLSQVKQKVLRSGDEVTIPVNRLKVPGKDDSFQEARIRFGSGKVQASVTVLFVPAPTFQLELASETILLLPDETAVIDASLRITQGKAVLVNPPSFRGRWVELEFESDNLFPLELDARGKSRLPMRLRVHDDTVQQLRESALGRQQETLRRGGLLSLAGMLPKVGEQEPQLPVEVGFLLGPELFVEPFRERSRLDVTRVRGLQDEQELVLKVSNGTPGTRGRIELVVRHLDVEYGRGGTDWVEFSADAFPMQIASGESRELKLRLLGHRIAEQDTARLAFVSNDPAGRDYFLRLEMRPAAAYPGWVVIDLGTSNTCAALVDANQATELVEFEREQVEATNLPSVICYLELARHRAYEVGTWAWERSTHPAAARSVVVAAKRYLGDEHRFQVVPVDEPAETFELAAEEVVTDLLAYTLKSATEMLLKRDTSGVVLNRVLICHPSRFSVHQIEELKAAVTRAQRRLLGPEQELEEPRTLQEPIGAALHFLNRWESHAWVHQQKNSDEAEYSLLVYDFGGGTLDITLVRVRSRRRVRDASGSPAALTERLADWVRDRCEELAGPRYQVTSEQAEANDYLIDKFVASMVAALGAGETVGGLVDNPLVGEKLTLTLERDGEEVEKSFARNRLLERSHELEQLVAHRAVAEEHPYSYTVEPEVLGATGDRWLGGEDVTAITQQLLANRLLAAVRALEPESTVVLPLGEELEAPEMALTGRRNLNLMRNWAERLKVLLSEGAGEEAIRATFQSVHFWVDGAEQLIPGTVLWKQAGYPSLDEIQQGIAPRLEGSVAIVARLLEQHQQDEPEVVLRVGRASKLPLVEQVLQKAYPRARHLAPERAKQCVVEGAATFPIPGHAGGGVQLSRGARRAGVRVRLRSSSLVATTSRLGLKVVEGAGAYFHEVIAAGVPVPRNGLRATLPGVVLAPGENYLQILENAGYEDSLVLNGRPNPDIDVVRQATVSIPTEADPLDLEEVEVEFILGPDLSLELEVRVHGLDPIRLDTIPSSEMGTRY